MTPRTNTASGQQGYTHTHGGSFNADGFIQSVKSDALIERGDKLYTAEREREGGRDGSTERFTVCRVCVYVCAKVAAQTKGSGKWVHYCICV